MSSRLSDDMINCKNYSTVGAFDQCLPNTVPENIFIYVNIQLICNTLLCDSNLISFNVLLEEPGGILENEDTVIITIFLERDFWMNIRKVTRGESDGDSVLLLTLPFYLHVFAKDRADFFHRVVIQHRVPIQRVHAYESRNFCIFVWCVNRYAATRIADHDHRPMQVVIHRDEERFFVEDVDVFGPLTFFWSNPR